MKITLNCCQKPVGLTYNQGLTLFKGEKPETDIKAEIKTSPASDTFTKEEAKTPPKAEQTAEATSDKTEKKCSGENCK